MVDEKAPTNVDLAAKVLRDVAAHYRTMAEENPEVQDRLLHNAQVCEDVARLVQDDPLGGLAEAVAGQGDSTVH